MRRVTLEELCAVKNWSARRNQPPTRRSAAPAHTRQRFTVTVGLDGSLGFGRCMGLIGPCGFC